MSYIAFGYSLLKNCRKNQGNLDIQSVSVKGLYPCGEGAGYAGGIMSAAVDGVKAAEKIIGLYKAG